MCGICGLICFENTPSADAELLRKMADAMVHRGPDDVGIYIGERCGFGHRRLSIIDVKGGQQPMSSDEGGSLITIVYNGEIYNYLDLKGELLKLGYRFVTDSDTEVVLVAYREWGDQCVNRLRGMFSFAIWDEKRRRLFLARDRMGIKPLYYSEKDGYLIFASEIKAILASNMVQSNLEPLALDQFLSLGYVPAPMTMFKGISKLLPGHRMSIDANGRAKIERYWNWDKIRLKNISFSDAQEKLEHLLRESVQMRLMSEVPLGVFLSGGLDSSAITALMSVVSEQPIKTFSVGYAGADEANELGFARQSAGLFQTDHHEFVLKPYDFLASIKELVGITEEPLVESAAIPLYQISKKAKPYATVLLSGEGSDEVFAGYGLYQKMMDINRLGGAGRLVGLIPDSCLPSDKSRKYIDWLSNPIAERYRGTSGDLTERIKRKFYSRDFFGYTKKNNYLDEAFLRWFRDVETQRPLSQLLYVDGKTWLPDDLLLKADKMTMATSVELRVPFLDHKIVEFAASLPSDFKIRYGEGKFILKKLMEKYLPKEIIYRKKMGFTVPTQRWFAGDLLGPAKDIILSRKLLNTGWFQRKYLETMLERHGRGKEDYSRRIFSLLVLYHWLEIFG